MANIKQIGMAAGTFSITLGIGFVMQNGDALAARFGTDTNASQPAPFTQTEEAAVDAAPEAVEQVALEPAAAGVLPPAPEEPTNVVVFEEPALQEPELFAEPAELEFDEVSPQVVDQTAAVVPEISEVEMPPEPPVQLATFEPEVAPEVIDEPLFAETDCVPEMSGVVGSGAAIKVMVNAPCHQNSAFTMHHQGMMFTHVTDDEGRASMVVPALAEVSVVIAAFENGDVAVATVTVPNFADFDRAVLQWQGDAAIMLSAYEGDAKFGDDGHIFMDNPGDMARLATSEGGYLMRLGDPSIEDALMAEVYTFPTGSVSGISDVMLVAEAEITADNCGTELSAQSIQVFPNGETSALDLTMQMPDCDAVGDFLVLQNMFEDLTITMR